ncbi:hypothetical protein T02_16054 [Trichinella nativa]|uniref:Uncharacterized protein n=1 Tax=Trichinella nativa TaxID=6335 RepID=A0A0V1L580_9BILA|nr:hypothetical protein T02_16054 [Trichinella nativa]
MCSFVSFLRYQPIFLHLCQMRNSGLYLMQDLERRATHAASKIVSFRSSESLLCLRPSTAALRGSPRSSSFFSFVACCVLQFSIPSIALPVLPTTSNNCECVLHGYI